MYRTQVKQATVPASVTADHVAVIVLEVTNAPGDASLPWVTGRIVYVFATHRSCHNSRMARDIFYVNVRRQSFRDRHGCKVWRSSCCWQLTGIAVILSSKYNQHVFCQQRNSLSATLFVAFITQILTILLLIINPQCNFIDIYLERTQIVITSKLF